MIHNPVRIRLLGKDYTLRVAEGREKATEEMADYLEEKLQAFKLAHPEQSDLTAAAITALAITEELFQERTAKSDPGEAVSSELNKLEKLLSDALAQ